MDRVWRNRQGGEMEQGGEMDRAEKRTGRRNVQGGEMYRVEKWTGWKNGQGEEMDRAKKWTGWRNFSYLNEFCGQMDRAGNCMEVLCWIFTLMCTG